MGSLLQSIKKTATILLLLYSCYLVKTLMGINILHQYSASWILKAPLQPIENNKAQLCQDLENICSTRKIIQHKVQRGVDKAKQII